MAEEKTDLTTDIAGLSDFVDLLDKTPNHLDKIITALGYPAFHARQLFEWLHKGVSFNEMTNMPKALLLLLESRYVVSGVSVLECLQSERDGTRKLLFGLRDGNAVEGVIMDYRHGSTLCLSTQVGCRMGCVFCASTVGGRVRNLSAGEMLGQVVAASKLTPVGNLVLMGSGEPFDNYEQTVKFLRLANHPGGMCHALRRISVSTCGLVPEMLKFTDEGLPVTLSVSLHAPNDEIRKLIMPVAVVYSIESILDACREYIKKTGRRVIFEYALIGEVNSLPKHAEELSTILRGMQCHVNVIPLNAVPESPLKGVSKEQVDVFIKTLEKRHISATRRRDLGTDIAGACGQLRRRSRQAAEAGGIENGSRRPMG